MWKKRGKETSFWCAVQKFGMHSFRKFGCIYKPSFDIYLAVKHISSDKLKILTKYFLSIPKKLKNKIGNVECRAFTPIKYWRPCDLDKSFHISYLYIEHLCLDIIVEQRLILLAWINLATCDFFYPKCPMSISCR